VQLGLNGDDGLLGVNGDGDAAVNVGLLDGDAADPEVSLSLGGGNAGNVLGRGVEVDLFGSDVDDTETGSVAPGTGGTPGAGGSGTGSPGSGSGDVANNGDEDAGDNGAGGPAVVSPAPGGAGVTPRPIRPGASGRLASVTTTGSTACFSPDQTQIDHLLGRNTYSAEVTARLSEADNFRLVPINLCADAKARLDAALAVDANIGALHQAIAADAEISAALEPSYAADDVLAADQLGEDLTVYVY
jgi:hypothetical protein